jgi:putative colanic acid biosynthesis acetyltransferase WcaB
MHLRNELLALDLKANANSAKGRLVMRMFRFGQALPNALRKWYQPIYYVVVDIVVGVSLPLQTEIGGGFVLRHGQGVVISWKSKIGSECELHQHVTLGEKDNAAPVLGNQVTIGANSVLLGGILIGDGAVVGAGSVVLTDVPAGGVVAGNPAKVIRTTIGAQQT